MTELFASGRVVDLILGLIVLEATMIVLLRRTTSRGLALRDIAWNLAAGICLLLALRSALVGSSWRWIALALSLAFVAHIADLRSRARR